MKKVICIIAIIFVALAVCTGIVNGNNNESKEIKDPDQLLFTAIEECDYDKAEKAIREGANVNKNVERYLDDIDEAAFGNTPLQIALNDTENGKIAKLLIENGADVNGLYNNGESNLMFCARNRIAPFVALLLASGANVDYCTENGETVLSSATINEIDDEVAYEEIIEILFDYDAKVTSKSVENAFYGYYDDEFSFPRYRLTKLLLKQAKKQKIDDISLDADLVNAFITQEGIVDSIKRIKNMSAPSETDIQIVLACAAADNTDAIKHFLENSGDVNLTDEYGLSMLMVAASCGSEKVLKLLLENGAEIAPVDNKGESALVKAKIFGEEACYRLLLKHFKETVK